MAIRSEIPAALLLACLGLPATFLLRLTFQWLRPGVWMLRAGRQRGVLRRLRPLFKLRDPIQQRLHEGMNCRSHLGFKFWRNRERIYAVGRHHARRPRKPRSCPDQFAQKRPQGVNGYVIEAFGLALKRLIPATKIWRRMYQSERQLAADGLNFMKEEVAKRWK